LSLDWFVTYDRPVSRRWLAALAVCGFWGALGTSCDSGQRPREPIGKSNPVPVLVGVTREDLYPEPSWNFVFGMASLQERVGVQSFARQDPAFFGEPRPAGWQTLARRRATWTLVHEISHMFGMTGSSELTGLDSRMWMREADDRRSLKEAPCLPKSSSFTRLL